MLWFDACKFVSFLRGKVDLATHCVPICVIPSTNRFSFESILKVDEWKTHVLAVIVTIDRKRGWSGITPARKKKEKWTHQWKERGERRKQKWKKKGEKGGRIKRKNSKFLAINIETPVIWKCVDSDKKWTFILPQPS